MNLKLILSLLALVTLSLTQGFASQNLEPQDHRLDQEVKFTLKPHEIFHPDHFKNDQKSVTDINMKLCSFIDSYKNQSNPDWETNIPLIEEAAKAHIFLSVCVLGKQHLSKGNLYEAIQWYVNAYQISWFREAEEQSQRHERIFNILSKLANDCINNPKDFWDKYPGVKKGKKKKLRQAFQDILLGEFQASYPSMPSFCDKLLYLDHCYNDVHFEPYLDPQARKIKQAWFKEEYLKVCELELIEAAGFELKDKTKARTLALQKIRKELGRPKQSIQGNTKLFQFYINAIIKKNKFQDDKLINTVLLAYKNAENCNALAHAYLNGKLFNVFNPAKAIHYFHWGHDKKSYYELGALYGQIYDSVIELPNGKSYKILIDPNYRLAKVCYEKSLHQIGSCYGLARIYHDGVLTGKADLKNAKLYYEKAIDLMSNLPQNLANNPSVKKMAGSLYIFLSQCALNDDQNKDDMIEKKIISYLKKANNPLAYGKLGGLYINQKKYQKAKTNLEKSGTMQDFFLIAQMYDKGMLSAKDQSSNAYQEAIKYYTKVIETSKNSLDDEEENSHSISIMAKINLGILYLTGCTESSEGKIEPADHVKAYEAFEMLPEPHNLFSMMEFTHIYPLEGITYHTIETYLKASTHSYRNIALMQFYQSPHVIATLKLDNPEKEIELLKEDLESLLLTLPTHSKEVFFIQGKLATFQGLHKKATINYKLAYNKGELQAVLELQQSKKAQGDSQQPDLQKETKMGDKKPTLGKQQTESKAEKIEKGKEKIEEDNFSSGCNNLDYGNVSESLDSSDGAESESHVIHKNGANISDRIIKQELKKTKQAHKINAAQARFKRIRSRLLSPENFDASTSSDTSLKRHSFLSFMDHAFDDQIENDDHNKAVIFNSLRGTLEIRFDNNQAKKDFMHYRSAPLSREKMYAILQDISSAPYNTIGVGKPETLKGQWKGYLSRRIDDKNRIVYQALKDSSTKKIISVNMVGNYHKN